MSAMASDGGENDAQAQLRKAILSIMTDTTLSEAEKAKKRQELMMGGWKKTAEGSEGKKEGGDGKSGSKAGEGSKAAAGSDTPAPHALDENLKCAVCLNLCERPVTAPCQHNFCLACFTKWVNQGKKTCPTCRHNFDSRFARNPRINTALILAIRIAKNPQQAAVVAAQQKEYKRIDNESRPDTAFVTERAVRAGLANAASGKIMVSIPNDHFGPIEAKHDPSRNRGVMVGDFWVNRLHCRQWGAHFPHVAGIAGQSNTGAQSVVLSGGYEDDLDVGEWFLYTGSGGRDLSGNKRTNKVQSFDQEFENMNKALLTSCLRGLPVRVVRSNKEKSIYAPQEDAPVRYDGIYRILRAWRKPGIQKHLVCRYLFVRCDNSPAPWSSDEKGDSVRMEIPEEAAKDMEEAQGKVYEMSSEPYWDWLEDKGEWGWTRPSPTEGSGGPSTRRPADPTKKLRKKLSEHEKALKEFKCLLCKDTLAQPISTPCGHNFCKGCLDKRFEGVCDTLPNNTSRSLRVRKVAKPCPACRTDICDFLSNAQPNREMGAVIEKLVAAITEAKEAAAKMEKQKGAKAEGEEGSGDAEDDNEGDQEGEEQEEGGEEQQDEEAEQDQEEQEGDGAGPSSAAAGPSSSNGNKANTSKLASSEDGQGSGSAPAEAAPADAGGPQGEGSNQEPAEAAAPKFLYAKELAALLAEFPNADEELVKGLLIDQSGDVQDVKVVLKKLAAPPRAKRSPSAAGKKRGGRGGGRKAGSSAAGGRKRGAAAEEEEEGEEAADEEQAAGAAAGDEEMTVAAEGQEEEKEVAVPAGGEEAGGEAVAAAEPAKKKRGRPAGSKAGAKKKGGAGAAEGGEEEEEGGEPATAAGGSKRARKA